MLDLTDIWRLSMELHTRNLLYFPLRKLNADSYFREYPINISASLKYKFAKLLTWNWPKKIDESSNL